MLPDVVHFALMLLLVGGLLRCAEYIMAKRVPGNVIYKFLVFSY